MLEAAVEPDQPLLERVSPPTKGEMPPLQRKPSTSTSPRRRGGCSGLPGEGVGISDNLRDRGINGRAVPA